MAGAIHGPQWDGLGMMHAMAPGQGEKLTAALSDRSPELLGGDASKFGFALTKARLLNGDEVAFTTAGVTAIVGGNNVGKSTFLVELINLIAHHSGNTPPPSRIVSSIETLKEGDRRDAVAWLAEHATFLGDANNPGFQRPNAGHQHVQQQVSHWGSAAPETGPMHPFLCFYGNAQGRFGMAGNAQLRDSHEEPASHPVHALQDDRQLLDELNATSLEIFRTQLTLDNLGRTVRLRVGALSLPAPPVDAVTQEYRDAMAQLPELDAQGDGMRSLLGLLLPLITAKYPLIAIDEPEAFLHPPQAHALGRSLGSLAADKHVQVIVATHDKDFLAGLLESDAPVSVVRLTRDGSLVRAHQLPEDGVRDLWTDPVLRYTNVLDGLFYQLVVLAEAENDCSYLAAALDALSESGFEGLPAKNEVLFLPTGGKDGMAKVARSLSSVNVPVVAAPDLDALSDRGKLKALVEAVGGSWNEDLDSVYDASTRDLRVAGEVVKVGVVVDAVNQLLGGRRDEQYTQEHRDTVKAQLRAGSGPWAEVKQHGLSAFKGEAGPSVRRLLELLADQHVVLVHDGELESLAPEVSARKGPGWLSAALEAGAHKNNQTQAHILRVVSSGVAKTGS
ncbi:MAG: AAA family ATPase [Actinobacteria bacterium]|nr:AAA family ATPase [Actinomycetota bacterium]